MIENKKYIDIDFISCQDAKKRNCECVRYGADLSLFFGELPDSNGLVSKKNKKYNLCFNGVKALSYAVFKNLFSNNSVVNSVSFPDLVNIGNSSLYNAFYSTNIMKASFPKLKEIDENGLNECFYNCDLTSIEFPKLEKIKDYGMRQCFLSNTKLTTVKFDKLNSVGAYGFAQAFSYCDKLENIYFPELKNIGENAFINFINSQSKNITIHFRADMESVVTALPYYENGFGNANAIILFDL